nr:hypothetical protein [Tanacetum cinerariifolium]
MFKVFNRCLTTRTYRCDQTKINILQLFHVVVNRINVDYVALLWWDFMNIIFQKKEAIWYPYFIKLIIVDLMKKFTSIPPRIKEDYHSIKDDILLRERDEIAEATLLSLTLHKTTLAIKAQENVTKVQEKLAEETIEKMVEGEEDEESYVSEFADFMLNDDVDDSGTRIEPESHKEHLENVNDDDEEIEKEKNDDEVEKEKKDDDVEKTGEDVKEKDNDEVASGSMEFRNEKIHILIPTPTRSPRNDFSSDKTISKELTATISPTTATTSKDLFIPKCKKRYISYKTKILPGSKIREVLDHCNKVVPEMTFTKTNEIIKEEMPRLVVEDDVFVNRMEEIDANVLYNGCKRIYVTKYVQIDGPPKPREEVGPLRVRLEAQRGPYNTFFLPPAISYSFKIRVEKALAIERQENPRMALLTVSSHAVATVGFLQLSFSWIRHL